MKVIDLKHPKLNKTGTHRHAQGRMHSEPDENVRTLIDAYIETQQQLDTPVARFAHAHESRLPQAVEAVRRQLIPVSKPSPGEQYAFEVNLDSCTGCKSCVSACHSLNGLDETETWRDVGLLHGGTQEFPFQQTITSACHHCEDPACLEGCPVLAYEKDPVTGIVSHLDDQCIGCQYCILKCPYDVPKYNKRLGIVRKCDMCQQRLSVGEAPACVQACPTQAISIVKVPVANSDQGMLMPGVATHELTRPTTRYTSQRALPANARPSDARALYPQHAHLALVSLLVLTQAGYGLLLGAGLFSQGTSEAGARSLAPGALLIVLGLLASVAHLGKPMRAWRVFLGLRRSWLSREAVLLGASAGLLAGAFLAELVPVAHLSRTALLTASLVVGCAGVFCSAMIYISTGRHHWRSTQTFLRMGGTLVLFSTAVAWPGVCASLLLGKLILEARSLLIGDGESDSADIKTSRLLRGPLRNLTYARYALGFCACAFFQLGLVGLGMVLLFAGEFIERVLYFRAVDAPKMPGVPTGMPIGSHN